MFCVVSVFLSARCYLHLHQYELYFHLQDNDLTTLGIDICVPYCCCDKFPTRIYHGARTPGGSFHMAMHHIPSVSYTHLTLPTNREV